MSSPLPSPASRRGFLLVVLAALCWGTSGVSGRIVADRTDLGPLDIAWHRMAIGAVVLLIGTALTRRRRSATHRGRSRAPPSGWSSSAPDWRPTSSPSSPPSPSAGVSIATLVALGLAPLLDRASAPRMLGHGRPGHARRWSPSSSPWSAWSCWSASPPASTPGRRCVLGALLAVGLGARLRRRHPGGGRRARRRAGRPWPASRAGRCCSRRWPWWPGCGSPPTRWPWACCSTWAWCPARWRTRCSSPGCGRCRGRSPRS